MSDPNDQSTDEGDSEEEKEERGEEGDCREGREQVSHVRNRVGTSWSATSPLDCPGRTEPDELPLREHRPAVGEAGGGVPGRGHQAAGGQSKRHHD